MAALSKTQLRCRIHQFPYMARQYQAARTSCFPWRRCAQRRSAWWYETYRKTPCWWLYWSNKFSASWSWEKSIGGFRYPLLWRLGCRCPVGRVGCRPRHRPRCIEQSTRTARSKSADLDDQSLSSAFAGTASSELPNERQLRFSVCLQSVKRVRDLNPCSLGSSVAQHVTTYGAAHNDLSECRHTWDSDSEFDAPMSDSHFVYSHNCNSSLDSTHCYSQSLVDFGIEISHLYSWAI